VRRIVATSLVVLASLLAFFAIFAIWINRQALNTDNWTRTSSELLEQPVIRDQVAARLTDELYHEVDVTETVRDLLPPRAEALAGPAANALRGQVEKVAQRALARPDVQALWADANRAAHEQLLNVLEGGGTVVSTEGGKVVLDTKALLGELEERVGVGGRLQTALPAAATQITILESDQLGTAQDVAQALKGLPVLLLLLAIALVAAAMLIAPRWRRRALRAIGIGFIVAGAAVLLGRALVGDSVVDSLAQTAAGEPAVAAVWDVGTSLLVSIATATIAYGVVMVFAAWLAGPTRLAVASRRTIAPYVREPVIAFSVLALVLAVLVWWAPTPAWRNGIMFAILAILLAIGVEALRRQVVREFPEASRAAAVQRQRDRLAAVGAVGRHRASAMWASLGGSATSVTRSASGAWHHGGGAEDEDRLGQLERLARLQEAGVLDADEVRAEKARILNGAGGERVGGGS
jgi:hypothetical protein